MVVDIVATAIRTTPLAIRYADAHSNKEIKITGDKRCCADG